jgi:CRISPR/Cas system CSM-associated protein Csm3 (group 7 of RAMP superfamily)
MNLFKPFANGVMGVLHGHWQLELKTPLLIRHGTASDFKSKPKEHGKGRGKDAAWMWREPLKNEEWSQITDFNYHFLIDTANHLQVEHSIPTSSIRGALRNWAIKQLLQRERWRDFSLEQKGEKTKDELAALMRQARQRLEDTKNRWRDILSLFGSAYDLNPETDEPLTWAGRLRLKTRIPPASGKTIDGVAASNGPQNINRHVNVRNPLDRVTMAAKDKGLHFALEMSEGEMFEVDFQILNPKPVDVELLALWCDDLEAGYLRFGGLTSQGRGRVKITAENYQFYVSSASPLFAEVKKRSKPDLAQNTLFAGLWIGAALENRAELAKLDLSKLESV